MSIKKSTSVDYALSVLIYYKIIKITIELSKLYLHKQTKTKNQNTTNQIGIVYLLPAVTGMSR